ncbi:MAG: acylphosphatase [Candidatus Zixiibacteriota bacterium]|nr:MAG: acylphosphatase [candidate division Zixibacteria bacterium]
MNDVRAHLVIHGVVQGVGFRYFAAQWARRLGLSGWVRNQWDGSVETEVEGDGAAVEEYVAQMRVGPRSGHVSGVELDYRPYEGKYTGFDITR